MQHEFCASDVGEIRCATESTPDFLAVDTRRDFISHQHIDDGAFSGSCLPENNNIWWAMISSL